MKKILLLLTAVFVVFLILLMYLNRDTASPKGSANNNKPKLLCDSRINCSNPPNKVLPKGVCIPGGICTHS